MKQEATAHTLLIVDDERNTREGLARALRRDYTVHLAESAASALEVLATHPVEVMLSDVRMPGTDGIALLKTVVARHPEVVCIMLTAYGNVETAVEAMKQGAADFLTKPVNLDHLDLTVERAIKQRTLERENRDLKRQLDSRYGLESIIGHSPPMEHLFDVIRQAAPTQATVLIQGPSGTGKELVAQAIHRLSTRAGGPFVAVHCAALSSALLESELFGHERGAFTGAVGQRKGRFEMADGGTLFLDEISEIEPEVQVKLLRVLEERRFERVGGAATIEVDIRIIAATNRDLKRDVESGRFREDLYYRLDVVGIRMPPLRERGSDISLLSNAFIQTFAKQNSRTVSRLEPAAAAALQAYSWPGNVRELRNTIEKMVVLSRGETLTLEDVPPNIRSEGGAVSAVAPVSGIPAPPPPPEATAGESLAELEKRNILAALAAAGGNKSKAALALGISRRTLHRKLNEWNVEGL